MHGGAVAPHLFFFFFFLKTRLHPLNCYGELCEENDEQSTAMILIVLREKVAAATGCLGLLGVGCPMRSWIEERDQWEKLSRLFVFLVLFF